MRVVRPRSGPARRLDGRVGVLSTDETSSGATIRTEATFDHRALTETDLARRLTDAVSGPDVRTGVAQDLGGPMRLPVRVGKRRLGILLGRLPSDGSWLVAVGGGASPVMRLLGSDERTERARLVELVHEALVELDGVGDLRWHHPHDRSSGDLDRSGTTPWD